MITKKYSLTNEIESEASFLSYSMPKAQRTEKLKRMDSLLKKAVKYELTERQKKCITYFYYESKKVDEIAELLGIKPTTVYKHLKKARKALQKCVVYL